MSERRDSNSRPRPWQGRALPTELLSLVLGRAKVHKFLFLQNFYAILYFLFVFSTSFLTFFAAFFRHLSL
jgi:TM2 domain-containing membrane protein YozV